MKDPKAPVAALLFLILSLAVTCPSFAQAFEFWQGFMSGLQLSPPVDTPGQGRFECQFCEEGYPCDAVEWSDCRLLVRVNYSRLVGTPTRLSLFRGRLGENSELMYDLFTSEFDSGSEIEIVFDMTYCPDMFEEDVFVILYTDAFENGEVGAQLAHIGLPTLKTTWGEVRSLYR